MSLLQFCKTERQKAVVSRVEKGESQRVIAKELGLSRSTVQDHWSKVKAKAALQGYSPEHDYTHPVPDGFTVKGVSTYYNDEGKPVGQWVKSLSDKERQLEMLVERMEQSLDLVPPFKPTKPSKKTDDRLLSLLTITDFHVGSACWEAETGDNFDTKIAADIFLNAVHDMLSACPNSQTGLLNILGDFIHFDGINLQPVTSGGGHVLDADTRYTKIVDVSMSIVREAVKMMLKRFERVVVVVAEGNHDISSSVWLRKYIKHLFEGSRVEVIDNPFPYYAYLHGNCMLGFHHGHKMKLANLHKLFASEPRFREMWGKASSGVYIHMGHYHHERVIEDGGAIAEMHPSLTGRSSYEARGGWMSQRGAKVITYDKLEGEVHRTTVRPRL
jgi:hypothetical protein